MPREFPDNPLVGVGAVIVQDNRVLLIQRGQPPLLGEWSLPGGHLECGETLRDATIREAHEETGLTVQTVDLLGVYERIVRDEGGRAQSGLNGRIRYHYVLIDFLCRPIAGSPQAGSDAADVRWFVREELPSLNLSADTLDVIDKGLKAAATP
jgi:8-oxo-dGTP diphosphatase